MRPTFENPSCIEVQDGRESSVEATSFIDIGQLLGKRVLLLYDHASFLHGRGLMKTALWITAAIGFIVMAPAAQSRGIDCAKAVSRLDRIICADPEMRDYDARIAAAYANALAAWKGAIAAYVRRDQTAWLQSFRAIGTTDDNNGCTLDDIACLREEMHRRVESMESGTYIYSGVYVAGDGSKLLLWPRRANGYALRVFKPSGLPEVNLASLDEERAAIWDGPDFMVAKMGDANGLPLSNPQSGPDPDGCTLRMEPAALSMRVWQKGYCGGNNYAGSYRRDVGQALADYESELF